MAASTGLPMHVSWGDARWCDEPGSGVGRGVAGEGNLESAQPVLARGTGLDQLPLAHGGAEALDHRGVGVLGEARQPEPVARPGAHDLHGLPEVVEIDRSCRADETEEE